jgi:hypothetical protein
MMKLWNQFVYRDNILSDSSFGGRCKQFARLYGTRIIELGVRTSFLLHLLNVNQWGLLDQVRCCLHLSLSIILHIYAMIMCSQCIGMYRRMYEYC